MTEHYSEICVPFQIDSQDVRGRIVRLTKTIDHIIKSHKFTGPIAQEVGKAVAFSAMVGSMMKFDGIFTLQIKSEGLMTTLVTDYATSGDHKGVVRAYANVEPSQSIESTAMYEGKGYLMITIDQGQDMDRYQGIVEIIDQDLVKSVENYFLSSEQLPTGVRLFCNQNDQGDWVAAAIMLQHLARNSEEERRHHEESPEDQWNTFNILMQSLKDEEALDSSLSLENVLHRLYHDRDIRVFDALSFQNGCRCSNDKLRTVLSKFDPNELREIAEEGIVTLTCEFCCTEHGFEVDKLIN